MKQWRTPAVWAACSIMALTGLAACNGDKANPNPSTSGSSASAKPSPTKELPKVALPTPTFAGKTAGAAADVKIVDCPTDEGAQTAKLEITNSTKAPRDYAVTVIWLKNGDGTPLGAGLVTQKAAAPGKKVEVTVKAKVVAKADKCVLNVLAGSLK